MTSRGAATNHIIRIHGLMSDRRNGRPASEEANTQAGLQDHEGGAPPAMHETMRIIMLEDCGLRDLTASITGLRQRP